MYEEQIRNELLFYKYKNLIVELANTPGGRYLIKTKLGIDRDEKIIDVTPNGINYFIERTADGYRGQWEFLTRQYVMAVFLPRIFDLLQSRDYLISQRKGFNTYESFLHYSGFETKNNKYPLILQSTSDFTSDSGGDGFIAMEAEATYAAARDAATGDTANTAGATIEVGNSVFLSLFYVSRGFLPFDTSGLDNTAVISAPCTLTLNNANINGGTNYFYITQSTQASPTTLATADFDQLGSVDLGDGLVDFTSTGSGKTQTLNSTGRGIISLTGWTQLGLTHKGDFENTEPTIVNRADASSANEGTAGLRPKLTVTYTVGVNYTKDFSETITISEPSFVKASARTFAETVTITDSIVKAITRTLSDTINITDTMTQLRGYFKTFSDTITMSDTIVLLRGYFKTFSETITITDSIIKGIGRTLSDTITMSDTMTQLRGYFKTFTDTISISDMMWRFKRRFLTFTKQTPDSSSWTEESPDDPTWTRRS